MRPHILIATLAVIAAIGAGTAYAAIPDDTGVLHGCYKTIGGQLRLVDAAGDCGPSETPTQWNQAGPKGAPGPQGPTGPTGQKGDPGTFSGLFESPNHEYSVSVTDSGIVLESSSAKIQINGADIKIQASGIVTVQGSQVNIN